MFIEDSTNVTVKGCSFNQTGGNALMLSNNVQDSAVTDNEFVHTGDSAIATLGSSDMIFGTEPTYPNRITIARNHIREVGICTLLCRRHPPSRPAPTELSDCALAADGKQTSCYFQALASNISFVDNVCYNGPRAGAIIELLLKSRCYGQVAALSVFADSFRCTCSRAELQ